jgi:hypothetical protein
MTGVIGSREPKPALAPIHLAPRVPQLSVRQHNRERFAFTSAAILQQIGSHIDRR